MMDIKISSAEWADRNVSILTCPKCHGSHLHQYTVHTYHRDEDNDRVVHTAAFMDGSAVKCVLNKAVNNPSSRRHGLTILFECETCHTGSEMPFELDIWQHKGSTYMAWRPE